MQVVVSCVRSKKEWEGMNRNSTVPSVLRGGSRYIIKLHFPANALFICLHSDDFAGVPLLVDAHFHQQTFICKK